VVEVRSAVTNEAVESGELAVKPLLDVTTEITIHVCE
jgi:hypothetical protein